MEKYNPINNNLIVRQYKKEEKRKTSSGIILPDSVVEDNKDRSIHGLVVRADKDSLIKEGSEIWVQSHLVHGVILDDTPYIIVNTGDVDFFVNGENI